MKPIVCILALIFMLNMPTILSETDQLSRNEINWGLKYQKGMPPQIPAEAIGLMEKYSCYYMGDIKNKELYLTFDQGFENGNTSKILDILKKHNVKAAFFVVEHYINSSPELVLRMTNEGHLVCNHTANHANLSNMNNTEKLKREFTDLEDTYFKLTGKTMPKYFRPPSGTFSEYSLYMAKQFGYKTIFWSFAYQDWLIDKQPSSEFAKDKIFSRTQDGAILLLHSVSDTNAMILDDVITYYKEKGYVFKTLDELPH